MHCSFASDNESLSILLLTCPAGHQSNVQSEATVSLSPPHQPGGSPDVSSAPDVPEGDISQQRDGETLHGQGSQGRGPAVRGEAEDGSGTGVGEGGRVPAAVEGRAEQVESAGLPQDRRLAVGLSGMCS